MISNLFGAIPLIGDDILILLWGGFSVDCPTLKRFFAFHFLLPFIILIFSVLHLLCLHKSGSSNPLGVDAVDFVFFYPKYVSKDIFCFFSFYGVALLWLVFYYPNFLGHPDNYIMANALITPKHITPEWYFEPYYGCGKIIYNKRQYGRVYCGTYLNNVLFIKKALLKHRFLGSFDELMCKNTDDALLKGQKYFNSGIIVVISIVTRSLKVPSFIIHYKKAIINKWARYNSENFAFLRWSFPRYDALNVACWRVDRKVFHSIVVKITKITVSHRTVNRLYSSIINNSSLNETLIINKGLSKELNLYSSKKGILEKLVALNKQISTKYVNLTKEYLCDPLFLKFAYYLIKISNIRYGGFNNIDTVWFSKTANLLKQSQYEFKLAKQKRISNHLIPGEKIHTRMFGYNKIIEKAIAIILEVIYEKNDSFQDEAHAFRPNKSSHTVLKQIKYNWKATPYYIECDIIKTFDDINRNTLINILEEKISDKRFVDLIRKLCKTCVIWPDCFWLRKINGVLLSEMLSPLLCNIYLNKLDLFIKKNIIEKFNKGVTPQINPVYLNKLKLTHKEKKLPAHIQHTLKKGRRRHVEKLSIKTVIGSVGYIRVKYVRYASNFLIGVTGPLELVKKILELTTTFLQSNLHLTMNNEKTRITNIYGEKARFLGMLIYHKKVEDLPYRKSREVENMKRVYRNNKLRKSNIQKAQEKNIRMRLLKALNDKIIGRQVLEQMHGMYISGGIRERVRKIALLLVKNDGIKDDNSLNKSIQPQKTVITNIEIMRRLHHILKTYNAVTVDRARKSGLFPIEIRNILKKQKLTYCPEQLTLSKEIEGLLMKTEGTTNKRYWINNWVILIKELLRIQSTLKSENKVTLIEPTQPKSNLLYPKEGRGLCWLGPSIVIDRQIVYDKLKLAGIMNNKNNPSGKLNITTLSDYNIISYYNSISQGLLSYYRCADDFYKIQNIVNWFIRHSAISTLKLKHKLPSKKAVLAKYGIDFFVSNQSGHKIHLISTEEVKKIQKDYLLTPRMDWVERTLKVWVSYSTQIEYLAKCSIPGCVTPYDKVELQYINMFSQELCKGGVKKSTKWKALLKRQKQKLISMCRRHCMELVQD